MRVSYLKLRNYRNYIDLDLSLSAQHTAFLGENGSGKTNLLEAIYLSSITRSFRTSNHRQLVRFGEQRAIAEVQWQSDLRGELISRWEWQDGQKSLFLNQERIENAVSYFGHLPLVALVPEDMTLTREGPNHRRRFMDMMLSQQSPIYFDLVKKYSRLLKIRNRFLREARERGRLAREDFSLWQESFLEAGKELITRRSEFLKSFGQVFTQQMVLLADGSFQAFLEYRPDTVAEDLDARVLEGITRDIETGTTRHGPHRDDIRIQLEGHDLRDYGSQGQHKLVLIGLKLAEVFEIKRHRGELPLLLMDDLFSELDQKRIAGICDALPDGIQTLVTSTQPEHFREYFPGLLYRMEVKSGQVRIM